ncbi:MAG: electron transporter SenC [Proteobacteria bacterium]|nr:electron transporter SenC [Pseudomonadota bacterium]
MDRRSFLGLGLAAPALSVPGRSLAATERPRSRAAQAGYLPNIPLLAHTGERFRFYDDLIRERTVLFNFFLVSCSEGRCPLATAKLRAVQDLLGERMGRDVFFYSISLQPEVDTRQVLKEYAEAFDVKPGWLFLTGKKADIELLRRSQGFVDNDPERDKDLSNHVGMARYGNDRLERWGAVSVNSEAENIASTFKWLTS